MKYLVHAALLLVSSGAQAICLNPFGCEPKTRSECIDEASKRPTSEGVRVARALCLRKFPDTAPAAPTAADSQEAAGRFAQKWSAFDEKGANAKQMEEHFGPPFVVVGPVACTRAVGKAEAVFDCYIHQWQDARPGRTGSFFVAEYLDISTKPIWWMSRDSISR